MGEDDPVRFGAEFGPDAMSGTSKGVGLATFKRLVWISNLGGLLLVAIALEMAYLGYPQPLLRVLVYSLPPVQASRALRPLVRALALPRARHGQRRRRR